MQTGARICPRCATRVDERRARTSPFCLQCGAPLGASAGGSRPPPAPRSPLFWVAIIGGALFLLGTCGIGVSVVVLATSKPEGPQFGTLTTSEPKLESTTPPPTANTAKTKPTVTPTFTTPVRPSNTPTAVVVTPPPAVDAGSSAQPFPRARANSELDRVNSTIQTCHKTGDPTGTTLVSVAFEPDNRTTVTTRPPFASTATGSCISARFQSIRIGNFEGARQTIDRTVRINATN